ncbi:hypothetical protein V6N12_061394 [Hibiscus sabdariffa]|uniref:Protein kinase domain-containing protein n=1 Tax=Hibiscus sabdariffa TaxID=183260 RepID=A0ABR2DYL2_9ROSI
MGIHMVFYFILHLPWLAGAFYDDVCSGTCGDVAIPFCSERCGNVTIRSPFGIETGCYSHSWTRVTCNETANGPKPFITGINLELLNSSLPSDSGNIVLVNNPVIYLNCGDKGNNGTTSTSSVHLDGTPFFFPSRYNGFGSAGCSHLATAFGNNQTEPISSCLQQRCGHQRTYGFSGCYAPISEDLASYTASVTEVINYGSKRFPQGQERLPNQYGDCAAKCGDVEIPYPFGIGGGCSLNQWFRVSCNGPIEGAKLNMSSFSLQLLSVSVLQGTVVVENSITYSNCLKKDGETSGVSVNLTGTPFLFSSLYNRFVSVGCGSLATLRRSPTDEYPIGGCMQSICADTVTSTGGCSTDIPSESALSSFAVNMKEIYPSNVTGRSSCGSAFIVDRGSSLEMMNSNHNFTSDPTLTHVPTTLQWAIPKRGLCRLANYDTLYSLDGQYCWEIMTTNYLCVCTLDNHHDYGYLATDACQGECPCDITYRYCYMLCLNTAADNCSSSCPPAYKYSHENDTCTSTLVTCHEGYFYSIEEDTCIPIIHPKFPTKSSEKWRNFPIIIGWSTAVGTIFVLLGSWYLYKVLERRRDIKLKQEYFKRNGGLLLQQQLSGNEGNIEKIKFFDSKELEKATGYYNENRILGRGGQGIVYKGMLTDGSIVAIKKPKLEEEKILDEMKLEQFMNEVIILSEINHRNVVKLLGCCLETTVPLLVYEFIPNGTLYHLIHEPNEEFPLTWEMRLRIATEIANALSYLHSAAAVPIYHRDVKSSNILLDDKYRAKVSDFGTSRSVALEQTHVTTRVQGTFGYLDPEYFRSNQFTEKSDVYSFGVVLVELLTGQKPVSSVQSEEEVRSLVAYFLLSMEKDSLFDILDQIVMFAPEEEIDAFANLAKRCLNLNGKNRPTMKQVAHELERIRSPEEAEADAVDQCAGEDSDIDDITEPSTSASCSTDSKGFNFFCVSFSIFPIPIVTKQNLKMEDMDIDSVVEIPDTPDRPSLKQVNGGNFVEKESNLTVAGRVGGSDTTPEGSLDRLRGRGRMLSANGLNRKHYLHQWKLSDSNEIERLKNTIVLSPVENAREHAPLFRKTSTERSRNSLREQDKDKGKAPCFKLPSKSSGFPEDHAPLDITEQKTHNQIPEMASLQSVSENCLAEGRKGQAPRNDGFYPFNSSGFSETSRNSCKGKEKIDDVGLKSIGSVMSNGKGVDLSNSSPLRMEKQLPAPHNSVAPPRAIGKRRLVRNGCISPQNITNKAKQNEQSQINFRPEQNFVNAGSSSPCLISEIVAEDDNSNCKGKRIAHPHASKEHGINFINLSDSPMSNNGEAGGIGDANRDACFEEKGRWRSTRNHSKNVDHAAEHLLSRFNSVRCQVSQRNENVVKRNHASGGKTQILCDSPETLDATDTAPVISKINQISETSHANMLPKWKMEHVLSSRNNGESSRVTPNDPDILFLGSSSESTCSRSSRIHIAEHLDVMDLDNSSGMRGINANNVGSMNDEDTEAKARQLEADEILARELQEQLYHEVDENIARALQQEEDAFLPTSLRTLHEPDHQGSTRQSRIQPPLRSFQNSSNRRGVQTHFPTSARVSRLRNRVLNQTRAAPSRTRDFQFPLDMDLDMRLDILEAMEAAMGDADDMGMASHIFQVQRDFNENDYEMLLALDDNNHQHGGASANQINSLPLSKVQTDNYEDCAVCLETPAIGETIRHLPCLHKFHKDCIDPWLRRKTSCPVCKSSIA